MPKTIDDILKEMEEKRLELILENYLIEYNFAILIF